MSNITLWGFDGSTYVRTVRMLLNAKGVSDFQYVSVNVLVGEPRSPDHLKMHPFGKVPILEHNGVRLLETAAITRYLNDVLPGASFIPATVEDRARMDMAMGLIDSYGYGALIGGVAGYHLFFEFIGGKNETMRQLGIGTGRRVIELIMAARGSSPFIAGELSLADFYLAPIAAYVAMTPDRDAILGVPGFSDWFDRMRALPCFVSTEPPLDDLFEVSRAIIMSRGSGRM